MVTTMFYHFLAPEGGYPQGGGGGYSDISIRRLGSFFGFKILHLVIFGGFQKNEYFGSMKILWIFLGFITKLDCIFRDHLYAF